MIKNELVIGKDYLIPVRLKEIKNDRLVEVVYGDIGRSIFTAGLHNLIDPDSLIPKKFGVGEKVEVFTDRWEMGEYVQQRPPHVVSVAPYDSPNLCFHDDRIRKPELPDIRTFKVDCSRLTEAQIKTLEGWE